MIRNICLLLYLFILLGLAPAVSLAECVCKGEKNLDKSLEDASLVVVGRVEEIGQTALRPGFKEVRFVVLKKFKWLEEIPKGKTVIIYTPKTKDDCGISFQSGYDYLVFAKGNPAFIKTTSCSRTDILEKSQLDQERLLRLIER